MDISKKKFTLQKILKSDLFSDSAVYPVLLRYLGESSINGKTPKETNIAVDVFEKNEVFDPTQDTIVRVHIYKLRKKLQKYYEEEGKNDKIRLVIPKGHYHVDFIQYSSIKEKIKKNLLHPSGIALLSIIIICGAGMTYLWNENRTLKKAFPIINHENPIWAEFLRQEAATLIVIGDRFIFNEYRPDINRGRRIRDESINSVEELEQYMDEFSSTGDSVWLVGHGNLPISTPCCVSYILPIFNYNQKDIVIRFGSEIDWSTLNQNNIIYIGDFKSLKIFKHFFSDSKFKFQHQPDIIYLTNDHGDTLQTYTKIDTSSGYLHGNYAHREDYAIAAKLPGPNHKTLFIFSGFSFISQTEIIKFCTSQASLNLLTEKLLQKFGRVPDYFEILFKVEGYRRTSLKTEILHINALDSAS